MDADARFETLAIHAGYDPDPATGAVMPPIYASSTFEQDAPGEHRGYEYARTNNPTRAALEGNLAALEGGAHARAFASGMAAINTVMNLLERGDLVVAGRDLYGGTHRLFRRVYADYGLEFDFVDMTDLDAVAGAIERSPALVWLESPTNPLLKVVDLEAVAEIAHDHGALVAVDNTFATPYLQRPLDLGADVVCHSLTKYLGGHSDVVAGALVTDDSSLDERFGFYQNAVGATPDPFACYLVWRGTKTLGMRMDRHCANARTVAAWLADEPVVERVYYPGLEAHPGHATAADQMADFGGMVSVELDADLETTAAVVTDLEVFTLAESLGGVESLVEVPAAMTHAGLDPAERRAHGIADGLIRLSIGVEHVDDLLADLDRAVDVAC
ncbi:MAG: cystathionine gamma-synthase [Halobacteriales archaeon]